jgi:hypothetical protein
MNRYSALMLGLSMDREVVENWPLFSHHLTSHSMIKKNILAIMLLAPYSSNVARSNNLEMVDPLTINPAPLAPRQNRPDATPCSLSLPAGALVAASMSHTSSVKPRQIP